MSNLKLTVSDVTAFLTGNLKRLKKIVFRPNNMPKKVNGKTFNFSPMLFSLLHVDMHWMLITLSRYSSSWRLHLSF